MAIGRFVRRRVVDLVREVGRALRGHDLPLYAAGLSFYAAVAIVPALLVALWVAGLVVGDGTLVRLGDSVAAALPAGHGLDGAVRRLVRAGTDLAPAALITALLIASLWGEGLVRAFDRLGLHGERTARGLRGRLRSLLLVGLLAVFVPAGLAGAAWLLRSVGGGVGGTALGVFVAFVAGWAGSTALLLVAYRVFAPERPGRAALAWGAAAAGSYVSGQALGFLLVLDLPLHLGRPFAGSDPFGTAVIGLFWLYLTHIAVLVGYLLVLRLDVRGGNPLRRPTGATDGIRQAGATRPATAAHDERPAA